MATEVYKTEVIKLLDGKELTLRPLPIKRKRVFINAMEEFRKLGEELQTKENVTSEEIENASYDKMVHMAAICVGKERPDLAEKNDDGEYENLEEVLDDDSMFKIIEVCGGVNLRVTPDQMTQMMKEAQDSSGTS